MLVQIQTIPTPEVDGTVYPQFTYSSTIFPDDIYNWDTIRVANPGTGPDDITIGTFTPREKLNGVDEDKTWDHVRKHRDSVLANSDGQIAEDMPDALKDQWKAYRQSLRDLPNKMIAAGVHPNFADLMFPMGLDSKILLTKETLMQKVDKHGNPHLLCKKLLYIK